MQSSRTRTIGGDEVILSPEIDQLTPRLLRARDAFQKIRHKYDEIGESITDVFGYCDEVLPAQLRLVQAYIVEGLAKLGWDAQVAKPGDILPLECIVQKVRSQHRRQFHRLLEVLEAGKLISRVKSSSGSIRFIRSKNTVPWTDTAAEICEELTAAWPDQRSVHQLVDTVGSQLAECLTGTKDALQLVFGDAGKKQSLEEFYQRWPVYRTPTLLLGEFLSEAFAKSINESTTGRFRVLEIGAGTGGTTRHLLDLFRKRGLPVDYYFTDISPSLVEAARKTFGRMDNVYFDTVDIEKQSPLEYRQSNSFHVVIATNCIHATRNIRNSLGHIREMLRDDGIVALIEATRSDLYFNDLIFGFFEGWWMFEDGRTHALIDEGQWRDEAKHAGFTEVLWTEGDITESKTVRVIAGFLDEEQK